MPQGCISRPLLELPVLRQLSCVAQSATIHPARRRGPRWLGTHRTASPQPLRSTRSLLLLPGDTPVRGCLKSRPKRRQRADRCLPCSPAAGAGVTTPSTCTRPSATPTRPPLQHLSTAVKAAPNGTLCTSGAPRPRLVQEGRGAATDTPCRAFCPADSPHGKHVAVGHHGAIHSRKPSLPSASMGINRTHLYTRAGRVERTEKKDQRNTMWADRERRERWGVINKCIVPFFDQNGCCST